MDITQFFRTRNNTVDATSKILYLLGVKITSKTLAKELEEHPDYPSLMSISDVLTSFGIENISIKTSIGQLAQMPTPCIAPIIVNKHEEKFTAIKSITEGFVTFLNPESQKFENISIDDFGVKWHSGVLMLVDAEGAEGEANYPTKRRLERKNDLLKSAAYAALPALVLFVSASTLFSIGLVAIAPAVYVLLMVAGLVTAGLSLWYEIDEHNPALQQICKRGAQVNCSAVLASAGSRIFGISWSSVGFAYFFGGITFLLTQGIANTQALLIVSWLSVLALPYIIFSIYYQRFVVKQWCVLCLTVQVVLSLQGIIVLLAGWNAEIRLPDILETSILIPLTLSYLIPIIAMSITIPALKLSKTSKKHYAELQRLRHNHEIFNALLGKQKALNGDTAGLGITLGNPDATHKIIKVCNPYCGPCAKAHAHLEAILQNNPDVQVQIIFTASERDDDLNTPPVKHFLAIEETYGKERLGHALNDWYLADTKDYDRFAEKYPMNGELDKQLQKIQAMKAWCDTTQISFTPTLFVNGHQLPEVYSVKDLKYFLSV